MHIRPVLVVDPRFRFGDPDLFDGDGAPFSEGAEVPVVNVEFREAVHDVRGGVPFPVAEAVAEFCFEGKLLVGLTDGADFELEAIPLWGPVGGEEDGDFIPIRCHGAGELLEFFSGWRLV